MAFRLKRKPAPAKQLAIIVRKQLESAADDLREREQHADAIRDARTRVKKTRAILRLLERQLGRSFKSHNRNLRSIAHQLSEVRDAEALDETTQALHARYPRLVNRTVLSAVRHGLHSKQRGTTSTFRASHIARLLRRSAKRLPRRVQGAAEPAAVNDGLALGYARARQALRDVKAAPGDAAFHYWRRRVKDHWYQVRLVETVHPNTRTRIQRLKQLEQWLGDDHNLVLLRAALLQSAAASGDARSITIALGCIERYQAWLRTRALRLGDRLFHSKPRAFKERVRSR